MTDRFSIEEHGEGEFTVRSGRAAASVWHAGQAVLERLGPAVDARQAVEQAAALLAEHTRPEEFPAHVELETLVNDDAEFAAQLRERLTPEPEMPEEPRRDPGRALDALEQRVTGGVTERRRSEREGESADFDQDIEPGDTQGSQMHRAEEPPV